MINCIPNNFSGYKVEESGETASQKAMWIWHLTAKSWKVKSRRFIGVGIWAGLLSSHGWKNRNAVGQQRNRLAIFSAKDGFLVLDMTEITRSTISSTIINK